MYGFLTAVGFLTTMPPLWRRVASGGDVARSFSFFPVVGGAIGLFAALLDLALRQILAEPAACVLVLAFLVVATGALHLDGFIDTCDGLFGGKEPGRRMEIMRDSRIGSFGAVAVSLLLVGKFAALLSLPLEWRFPILFVFPALGRWAMVYAAVSFPAGRAEGLGSGVKSHLGWSRLVHATLFMLALSLAALGVPGLVALVGVWGLTFLTARLILQRIPGLTGDTYGALNELVEVTALLGLPVLVSLRLPGGLDSILWAG